LTIPKG